MNNKSVLITGGTSGIGLELAKLFARDGYKLVIVARDEAELASASELIRKESDTEVITISKDLFEPDGAFELYEDVKAKGLTINVLVNNAGQGQYGQFIDTDINRELEIIQLNICSLVVLTKLYLKEMVERGEGKILNVSSVASKIPGPWQSVYHGTKAFVQSFTDAIRSEMKDRDENKDITITALLPGVTDTDFFNKAEMTESKAVQDKDKMADPADVAKDGYDALMNGSDKVVSGFMNKVQAAMSNVTPDEMVAEQVKKQQEPVNKNK